MKRTVTTTGVLMALVLLASGTTPEQAAAREASVCQYYKGDPLCKTVEEKYCVGASLGVEGQTCRTTTEFWYWS